MAGWSIVIDAVVDEIPPGAVVADVRWYLDGSDGRAAYEAGHIPDALWVDLDRSLAASDLPASEGRHPLPDPDDFAVAMGALGIGDESLVVAYDDSGGMTAGRLVVMLRMLGHQAALLDGGLRAWVAAGKSVESGPGRVPVPATFTPRQWPADRLASADQAAALAASGVAVLDARAYERFTGEVAVIDRRAGHMPGARSAPWATALGDDSRLRTDDELRAYYAALGVGDESVTYCGSGVSSCLHIVAMEHAGLTPARLYVASWSGWASDDERPAELGD